MDSAAAQARKLFSQITTQPQINAGKVIGSVFSSVYKKLNDTFKEQAPIKAAPRSFNNIRAGLNDFGSKAVNTINTVGKTIGQQSVFNVPNFKIPTYQQTSKTFDPMDLSLAASFFSGNVQKIPSQIKAGNKYREETQRLAAEGVNRRLTREEQTRVNDYYANMIPMGSVGKPAFSKAVNYLTKVADRGAIKKIMDFVIDVQRTGGKKNYGQLGQEVEAIAADVFGKHARGLSNKQLANAFDATLQSIGKNQNRFSLGLATDDIRQALSSEGKVLKGGVKVHNFPTETEIENRVQLGMGKPDLYTQRGKKIADIEGKPFTQRPIEKINPKLLENHGTSFEKTDIVRTIKDPKGITQPLQDIVDSKYNQVKNKVNILDYLRTPDRVFKKIGLGDEAALLRKQYDTYTVELPKEIDKITEWAKRAPKENEAIFSWLDGNKTQTLSSEGRKVAEEIKDYLKEWAVKLKLPKDNQLSSYITHLFPKGMVEKEFDPEIAKLIRGKVVGSVYDPFLQRRTGKPEYLQDTWQALSAYTKRATRKFYMDTALEKVAAKADALPEESYNYVKQNISHINMQPTQLDNLVDNAIKSTPIGYKLGQRPVASVTQGARQAVFRGLLGLNPGSAIRNLQQSTNTYATLGEKNFIIGAIKTIQNLPRFLSGMDTELHQVGALGKDIAGVDRTINPTKKFWQSADKGFFYLFNQAENINRGIAYYGGKAQALSKGLSEQEAIDYAKKVVRTTQFNYDVVDLPVALQPDIAKTIFQFAKYPIAQTEFIAEMLKRKDILGSVRFVAANLLFIGTIGKILGLEPKDMLPQFRFGTPPTLQAPIGFTKGLLGVPDQYGNVPVGNPLQRAFGNKDFKRGLTNYLPAGGQVRKTLEAQGAISEGGSYTPSGELRFPIENKGQALAFGIWSTPEGKAYLKNKQGKNLSSAEADAKKFEQDLKKKDAKASQLVNKMYDQFSKATPEEKSTLLQNWASQGLLNKDVFETFKAKEKVKRQQDAGDYAKAFSGLSTNAHRASYLMKLLQEKSPEEKTIILQQLYSAGLLTKSLSEELRRLRSTANTSTP